jgi:hypothetical protein
VSIVKKLFPIAKMQGSRNRETACLHDILVFTPIKFSSISPYRPIGFNIITLSLKEIIIDVSAVFTVNALPCARQGIDRCNFFPFSIELTALLVNNLPFCFAN